MSAELDRSNDLAPAVRLRAMTLADVPGVINVERDSYAFPWSEGVFRDCVRVEKGRRPRARSASSSTAIMRPTC